MDNEQILQIIKSQKVYHEKHKTSTFKERKNALKRLYRNIQLLKQEIFDALKTDLGKSEVESYMTEVGLSLNEIRYMIRHGRRFAKKKRVYTPVSQFPAVGYKQACPYGNVLVISPWNYPFMLSIEPIADAIAAGNSVILKPSEYSPSVSDVLKKLVDMTFERGHVDVVIGGKEECSFLLDQDFDYIFFTGSTRVGKIVMQKASEHFTPVTLELGGKCPCIVSSDADIKLAARRIVFGKFLNSGQTCVAPDYIYCHASVKDKLLAELEREIVVQYGVDPVSNDDYPRLVNQKQFDVMKGFITEKNLLFGGKCKQDNLKIEPTLISSTFDDESMQDEIFGPILPIVTFDEIDEAITNINSRPKPLALYLFSKSKKIQDKFMTQCDFGGGCINDTIMHIAFPGLGFGGVKQSGMGAYHGKTGFETFSHYKSILDKKCFLDLPMRYQPYSKLKYKIIKMFLK